ncbi:MAG: prolyl oligopeptidase family serine peptidase [Planctomycetes bacterium]|jgi:dipeptidyl aminopeptidase/acylaminoacyl peptidase|nr:prolyl oligopeptidase family serine peptidase [Planctomycetota bacterium]
MRVFVAGLVALLLVVPALGQTAYRLPPQEVVDIIDAPPTPYVDISPPGDALLLIEHQAYPSIELLAQPFLRLAGLRIDPQIRGRQRLSQNVRFAVTWLQRGTTVTIQAPDDLRIGMPTWSNDGRRIAFSHDRADGVELWAADAVTGKAKALTGLRLNDLFGRPFAWMSDNRHLLVRMVPSGAGAPPRLPPAPLGPVVEETAGKKSRAWTYQDLLKTPHDEDLFEYYGQVQLAVVDIDSGTVQQIGAPAIITDADLSPDEQYLLVTKVKRPFSYRVPYSYFTRTTEVWDRQGKQLRTMADLPISDEIPTQGVPTGPRGVRWQTLRDATLLWIEALDGGDPLQKVPHRDRLMRLAAPFDQAPAEVMLVQHRLTGLGWSTKQDQVLLTEYDRDRRWRTTSFVDLGNPEGSRRVLFDLSARDAYQDPGDPVYQTRPDGTRVMHQDGDWIYLAADGACETGDRPRLDRLHLRTREKVNLFQSRGDCLERFVAFGSPGREKIITRYESKTEPPNYILVDLEAKTRVSLTEFKDPAPQLTGLKKELVKYTRADGTPLSGTLYLPPGYAAGTKLPLVIWAYPLEYSDPATAGQVRGSPNSFTFFRGATPLMFLTQGYAVLMDATMPVVGDPETMNDTFVEQITGAGRAALDKLDALGVIDRRRVLVMGHSYGAFMTANLLAHSDDFAAGIARSGAYNRSLTPFGFQSERRSFWEAPEVYMKVSPFTNAHKINEPLLLIHGEADNNSGTHTMQSERLYQALKGNGGTARLVLLPFESHGYAARESVLHTLAEMLAWADKYVKNRARN